MTSKHRSLTTFAIVLVIAAFAAPSIASAAPSGTAGTYSVDQSDLTAPQGPVAVEAADPNAGFDWGDAAIGASVTVAICAICLGAAMVLRANRPSRSPAIS